MLFSFPPDTYSQNISSQKKSLPDISNRAFRYVLEDAEVKLAATRAWMKLRPPPDQRVQRCNSGVIALAAISNFKHVVVPVAVVYRLLCKNIFLCIKTDPPPSRPFVRSLHVTHRKLKGCVDPEVFWGSGKDVFSSDTGEKHKYVLNEKGTRTNRISSCFCTPAGENICTGCLSKLRSIWFWFLKIHRHFFFLKRMIDGAKKDKFSVAWRPFLETPESG